MWAIHFDESSELLLGEGYAYGARYVDSECQLKTRFLSLCHLAEAPPEEQFQPETLNELKAPVTPPEPPVDDHAAAEAGAAPPPPQRVVRKRKADILLENVEGQDYLLQSLV